MDCVLIQDDKAHQVWRETTKASLCYRLHENEVVSRPIFPQEVIDGIVEVATGTVNEGDEWNGEEFTAPEPIINPIIPGAVFLDRIENAEYIAVVNAADTAFANGDPTMVRWLERIRINGQVDVSSELAQTAKTTLINAGLLTGPRATAIFAPL